MPSVGGLQLLRERACVRLRGLDRRARERAARLIVPQRLAHKRFAVASDTNALGVVRYWSQ